LAASLGTVAGAVGSSVSDRSDILNATYGHREMLRRQHSAERSRTDDAGAAQPVAASQDR
jgi:hypothetical protein